MNTRHCSNCGRLFVMPTEPSKANRQLCSRRCRNMIGGYAKHRDGKSCAECTPERFLSFVTKTDGCWWWNGARVGSGAGRQFDRGRISWRGRDTLAHRVSWLLFRGDIPTGLLVCHHCDNPLCVRPEHLFVGTQRDNLQDAVRKGRMGRRRKHVVG